MWLSEKMGTSAPQTPAAELGVVSVGGMTPAVVTDGELRQLRLICPGGYAWRPAVHQQVALWRGEEDCILGVMERQDLQPGEIVISTGSAAIRLSADGRIDLVGEVYVNGEQLGGEL